MAVLQEGVRIHYPALLQVVLSDASLEHMLRQCDIIRQGIFEALAAYTADTPESGLPLACEVTNFLSQASLAALSHTPSEVPMTSHNTLCGAFYSQVQPCQRIIDAHPDGIVLTNSAGMIIDWNPAAERIFGVSRLDGLGGQHLWDLLYQLLPETKRTFDIYERYKANIEMCLEQQDASWNYRPMECEIHHADGTSCVVEYTCFPVQIRFTTSLCLTIHDVTTRTEREHRYQEQYEQAQLLTRVKSDFLADMSHEIRNPLNAIVGMIDLFLHTNLSERQRDAVETARTSSETLLALINNILDFSKIEADKLELEYRPLNLRLCIEEALDLVATRAEKKQIDLAYIVHSRTPPFFVGDITRIRQILVNLLSNAVKFTEAGEVVVSVESTVVEPLAKGDKRTTRTTNPLYDVHFAVRDTGIGIPQDKIDHLFNSFTQVDPSITRKYGGTGLGLTISQRLATMMGGTMWVESEVGKGSIFHVTIKAEAIEQESNALLCLDSHQPLLTGKHILIIDDHPLNQFILERYTRFWGMATTTVKMMQEGYDALHETTFDAIILSFYADDLDLLSCVSTLRSEPSVGKVPIVVFLPITSCDEFLNQIGTYVDAILTRPIKPAHFYQALLRSFAADQLGYAERVEEIGQKYYSRVGAIYQERGIRLLLAEDTPANQKIMTYILEDIGCYADVAANGLDVIDMFEEQPYDIILMDVQMPEMDGFETTRYIRSSYPEPSQPWIIAMTAHAMKGDRERCLAAGMNDYIGKPVLIEELIEVLARAPAAATRSLAVGAGDTTMSPLPSPSELYRCVPGEELRQTHMKPPVRIFSDEQPKSKMMSSHTQSVSHTEHRSPENEQAQQPSHVHVRHPDQETQEEQANQEERPQFAVNDNMLQRFLGTIKKGGPQVIQQMTTMFIDDMAQRLAAVHHAMEQQDAHELKESAHSLKSLSGQVGGASLSSLSASLETMGEEDRLTEAEAMMDQLDAEFKWFKTFLTQQAEQVGTE
jgi:PAS domain S-box-containing protein